MDPRSIPPLPTLENFVGNTPLVRLKRLPGRTGNTLLAKLEGNNPAGSVKDRPAFSMSVARLMPAWAARVSQLLDCSGVSTGIIGDSSYELRLTAHL